jgi:hypothetical protein
LRYTKTAKRDWALGDVHHVDQGAVGRVEQANVDEKENELWCLVHWCDVSDRILQGCCSSEEKVDSDASGSSALNIGGDSNTMNVDDENEDSVAGFGNTGHTSTTGTTGGTSNTNAGKDNGKYFLSDRTMIRFVVPEMQRRLAVLKGPTLLDVENVTSVPAPGPGARSMNLDSHYATN